METRLELAEFCVSLCLSRMAKMEVWMRKTQDKMDGVVPEVIDLTSEDGEGEEAIGDVLGRPKGMSLRVHRIDRVALDVRATLA